MTCFFFLKNLLLTLLQMSPIPTPPLPTSSQPSSLPPVSPLPPAPRPPPPASGEIIFFFKEESLPYIPPINGSFTESSELA